MVESSQLWYDSMEEAVGAAVSALGGAKKVVTWLWPALAEQKPETAYTRLKHCLNPEKSEKLSLDELMLIARKAREVGEHAIARRFGYDAGYEFSPLDPAESERRARKAQIQWHLAEASRLAQEDE